MNKANNYLAERLGRDALAIAELLQTIEQKDQIIASLSAKLGDPPAEASAADEMMRQRGNT